MKAKKGILLFLSGVSALVFIVLTSGTAQAETIRALDPRGIPPTVERIPLSPRLAGIQGARIYIVMSWPTNSAFDSVVKDLVPLLKERGAKEVTIKDAQKHLGRPIIDAEVRAIIRKTENKNAPGLR